MQTPLPRRAFVPTTNKLEASTRIGTGTVSASASVLRRSVRASARKLINYAYDSNDLSPILRRWDANRAPSTAHESQSPSTPHAHGRQGGGGTEKSREGNEAPGCTVNGSVRATATATAKVKGKGKSRKLDVGERAYKVKKGRSASRALDSAGSGYMGKDMSSGTDMDTEADTDANTDKDAWERDGAWDGMNPGPSPSPSPRRSLFPQAASTNSALPGLVGLGGITRLGLHPRLPSGEGEGEGAEDGNKGDDEVEFGRRAVARTTQQGSAVAAARAANKKAWETQSAVGDGVGDDWYRYQSSRVGIGKEDEDEDDADEWGLPVVRPDTPPAPTVRAPTRYSARATTPPAAAATTTATSTVSKGKTGREYRGRGEERGREGSLTPLASMSRAAMPPTQDEGDSANGTRPGSRAIGAKDEMAAITIAGQVSRASASDMSDPWGQAKEIRRWAETAAISQLSLASEAGIAARQPLGGADASTCTSMSRSIPNAVAVAPVAPAAAAAIVTPPVKAFPRDSATSTYSAITPLHLLLLRALVPLPLFAQPIQGNMRVQQISSRCRQLQLQSRLQRHTAPQGVLRWKPTCSNTPSRLCRAGMLGPEVWRARARAR